MFADEYRRKLTSPEKAAALIKEDDRLVIALTTAEPRGLLEAIAARLRADDLKRLEIFSLLPCAHAMETVLAPELSDKVNVTTAFVGPRERGLVAAGLQYFAPNHFHQVPRLLVEEMGVGVTVATVSPMDRHGYFSFGTANDYTTTAARAGRLLLVEVNPRMPRVFGDSLIHISEVDRVVEWDGPLNYWPKVEVTAADAAIGKAIAEMVPDGACLQLGVGGVPSAVAGFLENHRDLGVHTEVFSPAMVELIKKGVITGARKAIHPRKHVYTVAQGDQATFDFMNDNPAMESYPVSYVNRPEVIAQNPNLISINAVLQVDLLGQCNAEFLSGRQFSGTGGQLDFVRGAYDSPGGKSILAFHSTAKEGTISRVVPRLEHGAMITTPRMDTHYLVTEHGTANLKGKNTRERALAIIGLAHPDFRDELMRAAEEMYLL
ncbi:MAG: 4-hydroxybutyrate--acetyl-CoA CoA transferase [Desulfarculus sp.]|nr:4-hydroxybutyrate--acetyl-CoA CoA transferase [Desulfarculus sp.]